MRFFLGLKEIQFGFLPDFNKGYFNNETRNEFHKFFFILFFFASIINLFFISNDLWQDELYTIQHFVLVPLKHTLTDYHTTNNHIIFNFLANIYLKLINVNKIEVLLANPSIIRLLPFSFTMLSLIILYNGAKNNFGYLFAIVVLLLYTTSLQLYTFGTQVRGYSLSLLLMIVLLNQIYTSFRKPHLNHLILLSIAGFLLLVNLPSSLYLYLSFILLLFIELLLQYNKRKNNLSETLNVFLALSISLLLAGIFFWFKKEQLENNSLLQNSGNEILRLIKQPFTVYYRLIDLRLFLLIPIFVFVLKYRLNKIYFSTFLSGLLICPFIIYMFHNPTIILRIWIVLLPVLCYFLAFIILPFVKYKHLKKITIPLLVLLVVSMITLKYQILNKFEKGKAPLDLKFQYHLFGFEPFATTLKAKKVQDEIGAKILLHDMYWGGIKYYLPDSYTTNKNELAKQTEPIFLISDHFNEMNNFLQFNYHVIDSGHNNQFYKWYLLKKRYD